VSSPADPVVVASAAGKFTAGPRSSNVTKPARERPMPRGPSPRAAFTVAEFCEAHRISQAKYYEMKKEGMGTGRNGSRSSAVNFVRGRERVAPGARGRDRRDCC
jgi:hypothetical protein